MQHVRRRNGHFWRHAGVRFHKAKVVEMRMRREVDAADRAYALGLGLHTVKRDAFGDLVKLDALQFLEEIELVPGTAEFAVSGQLQANVLLLPDRFFDFA